MRRAWPSIEAILHIVWPRCCVVCGRLGAFVCGSCLAGVFYEARDARKAREFCIDCGNPRPCSAHPGGPYCCSVSDYGEVTRSVMHAMKYSGGREIAAAMGKILADGLARPDAGAIVPIPLHKGSERDYNQALLMAKGASGVWGIPVWNALSWKARLPRQARASGRAERNLPEDSILLNSPTNIPPAGNVGVFLVDDVYTTGNTMRAAKRALAAGGFAVAGAMVWSRSRN